LLVLCFSQTLSLEKKKHADPPDAVVWGLCIASEPVRD
jgi:hypothetical protein